MKNCVNRYVKSRILVLRDEPLKKDTIPVINEIF